MASAANSVVHLKELLADYEATKKALADLKRKYAEKTKSHIEKKKTTTTTGVADKPHKDTASPAKVTESAKKQAASVTPGDSVELGSAEKKRATPKCSVCKQPRLKGSNHIKCKEELAKKREEHAAKKSKRDAEKSSSSSEDDSESDSSD